MQNDLDLILKPFEDTISWKKNGSIEDRVEHCLSQYRNLADNAIFECRGLVNDVKSQFKALEIVIEGLTSEGMNHGQKRVIANHLITMLRAMVDKLDNAKFEYNVGMLDRYNFFRTNTPERRLHEKLSQLSNTVSQQDAILNALGKKYPEIFKELDGTLPF